MALCHNAYWDNSAKTSTKMYSVHLRLQLLLLFMLLLYTNYPILRLVLSLLIQPKLPVMRKNLLIPSKTAVA